MNPDARTIWQAPSWALAILLACLGMLGPFSIDTYLPAFTGIAKALGASPVAPMVGGFRFIHAGWHSSFWLLTGGGIGLFALNWKLLPETLHQTHRQPFNTRNLLRGYWSLASNPRFLMLALASGIPFNGMFLYVLSAPVFLGDILGLAPAQFFWFFVLTIAGIMTGAFLSGRMAGRTKPTRQIRYGFVVMAAVGAINLVLN